MEKIKTIFKRDWEGDRKVIDKFIDGVDTSTLLIATATEKLDGTNVRITIRNHEVVRVEKRRNPDKLQKTREIIEPWYVDADEHSSNDKWIFNGIKNTDFSYIQDGEHSGELIGKNIQGNPLDLEYNKIIFFALGEAPIFYDVPVTFNELKEWLPKQESKIGNYCGIEGIVWHCRDGRMFKIKNKDFK